MVLPSKEMPRGARGKLGVPGVRPPQQSWKLLAQRTPCVVPVGVWVESGPGEREENLAFASVLEVEEELRRQQQQKAAVLRRFQGEVKQRVKQQQWLRREQQLQKSYEAAERENCAALRCSGSAPRAAGRSNTAPLRGRPAPVIGCGGDAAGPAWCQGTASQPCQQQAAELSNTMKQVRHRLASCKALPQGGGPPEPPSSIWRQEKPAAVPVEDESEEQLLAGYQELPAALQGQGTALPQAEPDDDFYIQIEFEKSPSGTKLSCDGSVMDSSSPEPPQKPHTRSHAPFVLWAGVDQEESKKQLQGEYLRCRRLLMSLEREQVREQQRQKERQKRVTRIKSKKEKQRRAEERRMQVLAEHRDPSLGQGASETLAQLRLEERRAKKAAQDKEQRNKEHVRYVEALRAQLREKVKLYHIDLPPLCSCGTDFWDSHPDTCANNCVFYRNHKAYSRVLQSLISSCQPQPRLRFGPLAVLSTRRGTKHLGSHWSK